MGDRAKMLEEIQGYAIVCVELGVLGWDIDCACTINAACREKGVGFVLSLSLGERAFFFSDFQEHTVEERSQAGGQAQQAEAPKPITFLYPSFKEFLGRSPMDLQMNKVDPSLVLVALLFSFLRSTGPSRVHLDQASHFEEFCSAATRNRPLKREDLPCTLQDAYRFLFMEPLIHVASVLGGLLAQEVIKAITKRDLPLVNSVCFNAQTGAAYVERIPPLPKEAAGTKRKADETLSLDLDD